MATSSTTQGTDLIQWDENTIIQHHNKKLKQDAKERGDEFIDEFYDQNNIQRLSLNRTNRRLTTKMIIPTKTQWKT